MKNLILACAFIVSYLLPAAGQARPEDLSIEVPYELSRLLLSDQYLRELNFVKERAEGKFLKVSRINRFTIGQANYLDVAFEVRPATDFHWKPLGSIVSQYQYGSMGLVELLSVYYSPAVELPGGGASVGNN
jgi:hypothetical protein